MSQKTQAITAKKSKYAEWQQGDYVLGELEFFYGYEPSEPTTAVSKRQEEVRSEATDEETERLVVEVVDGLVVVSQTCDVVRDKESRPFVELSPIKKVDEQSYSNIKSGRSPRFAVIEALEDRKLVVDLDRVMTVEKPVLENWERKSGFNSNLSRRKFSDALGRKRSRPAFPNDFIEYIEPFRQLVVKKHGKNNDDGKALAAIDEIRVIPESDWTSSSIKVTFIFILNKMVPQTDKAKIDGLVQGWLGKLTRQSKYSSDYQLGYLGDFGAEEYVLSERLDYDYLSQ